MGAYDDMMRGRSRKRRVPRDPVSTRRSPLPQTMSDRPSGGRNQGPKPVRTLPLRNTPVRPSSPRQGLVDRPPVGPRTRPMRDTPLPKPSRGSSPGQGAQARPGHGHGHVHTPSPAGPSPRQQATRAVAQGTAGGVVTGRTSAPPRQGPPRATGSLGAATGAATARGSIDAKTGGVKAPGSDVPTAADIASGKLPAGKRSFADTGKPKPDSPSSSRTSPPPKNPIGSRTGESWQKAVDRLSGKGVRIEKNTSTTGPRAGKSYMVYKDQNGVEVHDYGMGKKYKLGTKKRH